MTTEYLKCHRNIKADTSIEVTPNSKFAIIIKLPCSQIAVIGQRFRFLLRFERSPFKLMDMDSLVGNRKTLNAFCSKGKRGIDASTVISRKSSYPSALSKLHLAKRSGQGGRAFTW